ncbi:MAG: antA/AntB antirepressor family protein, partial [Aeromonadaceae bacterium]|nr:antA/AntB antirepressor family protein [Aeromonadaceae bacterium]
MMIFNDGRTAQGEDLPKISQRIAGALAELVSLHEQQIGGKPVQTVNGRELHQFLEIGRDYSNWMKDRIAEYDFIEGLDFIRVRKFDSPILANQR